MALPGPHRFTVDDYYRMADAGVLGPDSRVELLDGEIVDMAPIGSRHAECVDRLNRMFVRQVGDRAIVRVQNPVRLGPYSEPEPDLSLLRPREGGYPTSHPGPDDVLLIVEVADTSALWDRRRKVPLYAAAAIPEVWLIDLATQTVDVSSESDGTTYRSVRHAHPGDTLMPAALPDISIAVSDVIIPT